ncbi:MAG TPA: hypothetical protein VFI96_04695 [Longimicrobiaceae bacterium]|nr:hypothetical protein [Longimicrobiaceae bacterium]
MRSALAALSLLFLGACYITHQPAVQPLPTRAPLEAHIVPMGFGGPLHFYVNRSAYTALFSITPGAGVSLVAPYAGSGTMDGRVFAGLHSVYPRVNNRNQYSFASMGFGGNYGPTYFFLIASERPLNLRQFGSYGFGLRSQLGLQFTSYDAYNTMEALAQRTLPVAADDGTWTTDMYVYWPDVIYSEPSQGLVLLQCGNYAVYVPAPYLNIVRAKLCATTDQQTKPDSLGMGRDTTKAQKPKFRDPGGATPPQTYITLMEKVRQSDQLDRARLLREGSGIGEAGGPRRVPTHGRSGGGAARPMTPAGSGRSSGHGSSGGSSSGSTTSRPSRPSPPSRPSAPSTRAPAGHQAPHSAPSPRAEGSDDHR